MEGAETVEEKADSDGQTPLHKGVKLKFYIYAVASLIVGGTNSGIVVLQSSINIKENIGTNALGIGKLCGSLNSLFLAPIAIRRIGAKWSLVIGEGMILLFIAANFYPVSSVMLVVGALRGLFGGFIWTAMPMYNLAFAKLLSTRDSKSADDYANKYTGIFFALVSVGQVLTGIASFAILQTGKTEDVLNTTNEFHGDEDHLNRVKYENCGANDCQDANITTMSINRYIPANTLTLYMLILTYCLLCAIGIGLHACFLITISDENAGTKKRTSISSTLKAILKQSVSRDQLLLYPLLFYTGLQAAFVMTEISRAYISCVMGVEKVGLLITANDVAVAISSLCTRKVIRKLGRNVLIGFSALLDLANFLFCLLWRPSDDTTFIMYLSLLVFGTTEAIWRNSCMAIYTEYFPENQEISFSVWNLGVTMGLSLGYFWSPWLCVRTKLYVQIALITFSMILYAVVEYLRRPARNDDIHPDNSRSDELTRIYKDNT